MSKSDGFEAKLAEEVGDDVPIHDTKDPDEVFLTSKSRLKLALMQYKEGVRSLRGWVNPFILLVTVGSILLVGNFQQTFGMSGEFWTAAYFITALVALIWLIYSLLNYRSNRDQAKVDTVIDELKKNTK